jgi:hypothetical protein
MDADKISCAPKARIIRVYLRSSAANILFEQ